MMKSIVFLGCLCLALSAQIDLEGKTDFQIWNGNTVYGHLNKHVDLFAKIEFRYKNSGTTFYYNHEEVELPIHTCSFFDIGPCYRQVFSLVNQDAGLWRTTYVPNLNATFFWHLGPYKFSDRSRFSYIIRTGSLMNAWQYRNKLTVYRVLSQKFHELRLFLDEEVFFEEGRPGLYQNRVSVGYNLGLFRKIRMDLAYRFRIVKITDAWERDNILVLNLYADF